MSHEVPLLHRVASRRHVLAGLTLTPFAALAAACGSRTTDAQDTSPPQGDVTITSITATVPPRTGVADQIVTPTAIAVETPKKEMFQAFAVGLEIPTLGIKQPVEPAPYDPKLGTWAVPDYGVATPSRDPGMPNVLNQNVVLLFSHSRWQEVRQPFYRLSELEPGSPVMIENATPKNAQDRKLTFEASEFKLVDRNAGWVYADLNSRPIDKPVLALMTTARTQADVQNPNADWILPKDKILHSAEVFTDPHDPARYLVYVVIATQAA